MKKVLLVILMVLICIQVCLAEIDDETWLFLKASLNVLEDCRSCNETAHYSSTIDSMNTAIKDLNLSLEAYKSSYSKKYGSTKTFKETCDTCYLYLKYFEIYIKFLNGKVDWEYTKEPLKTAFLKYESTMTMIQDYIHYYR